MSYFQRVFEIVGLILICEAIILNLYVIEQLDPGNLIKVIEFDLALVFVGIVFVFILPGKPIYKILSKRVSILWHRKLLIFLFILIAGSFLRFYSIGAESLWTDEAYTKDDIGIIRDDINKWWEPHPPLYFFAISVWAYFFGTTETALRSLSAIFGILAIPMIFVLARRMFDDRTAVFSALILSLSAFSVWYSQEARMYSLLQLIIMISTYFFIRLKENDRKVWALYVISTSAMIYTHYFGFLILIVQNLFVLFKRSEVVRLKKWLILQAAIFITFLPWINYLTFSAATRSSIIWIGTPDIISLKQTITSLGFMFDDWFSGNFLPFAGADYVATALIIALALLGFVRIRNGRVKSGIYSQKKETTLLLFLWLLFPVIFIYIFSLVVYPLFITRYFIIVSGALFILMAGGLAGIGDSRLAAALLIALISLNLLSVNHSFNTLTKEDWRGVADFLSRNAESEELVYVYPFDYYCAPLKYYNKEANFEKLYEPNLSAVNATSFWLVQIYNDEALKLIGELEKERVIIKKDFTGGLQVYKISRVRAS